MIELMWNAPISESKLNLQIDALALGDGNTVLDIGCGCGEILLRICEHYEVQATGIDSSSEYIREAKRRASRRNILGFVNFIEADAQQWNTEAELFDVVLCLGATHAFGVGPAAYLNALKRMFAMVKPGGKLLVSDAYAKQPVPSGYREFIGDTLTDEMTHEHNVRAGRSLGLIPLGAWTSSVDEWDEFEWSYQRIIEERASGPDADEATAEKLNQRRTWMDGYLRWGRGTLGYGTYLFKKQPAGMGLSEKNL